jgi:diketogulonate reductase-like aldo/keto reductase
MYTRRRFLGTLAGLAGAAWLGGAQAARGAPLTRPIPASGERIPVIGMGTWITFDVGEDSYARARRVEVLRRFFAEGGGMIDSSPMYGSAEAVLGHCLEALEQPSGLFSATKVWTPGRRLGIQQMEDSESLWRLPRFDLMQVHNLVDWETHLETLLEWKAQGRVRYLGVTTSHGRRHDELEAILRTQPIDFVQLTYNVADRAAEARLLPLAAERDIAVIVNRPFRRGALLRGLRGKPIPAWAAEIDCENWPQLLLKYIVSHPAVTCAIPATSRVEHMAENMGALYGRLPDPAQRARLRRAFEAA